jgi:hypothetical protein
MGGNHVADFVRYAEFHGQGHACEWMPQQFSSSADDGLIVLQDIFDQFTHVNQYGSRNEMIHVDRQAFTEKLLHCFRRPYRNMDDRPLVLHKGDLAVLDQQGERDGLQILWTQYALFQGVFPRPVHLFSQLGVLYPLDFWPDLFESLSHRLPPISNILCSNALQGIGLYKVNQLIHSCVGQARDSIGAAIVDGHVASGRIA